MEELFENIRSNIRRLEREVDHAYSSVIFAGADGEERPPTPKMGAFSLTPRPLPDIPPDAASEADDNEHTGEEGAAGWRYPSPRPRSQSLDTHIRPVSSHRPVKPLSKKLLPKESIRTISPMCFNKERRRNSIQFSSGFSVDEEIFRPNPHGGATVPSVPVNKRMSPSTHSNADERLQVRRSTIDSDSSEYSIVSNDSGVEDNCLDVGCPAPHTSPTQHKPVSILKTTSSRKLSSGRVSDKPWRRQSMPHVSFLVPNPSPTPNEDSDDSEEQIWFEPLVSQTRRRGSLPSLPATPPPPPLSPDSDETDDNQADDNQADGNQADDNQADDNQADDNQADDNQEDDNQADDDQAGENQDAEGGQWADSGAFCQVVHSHTPRPKPRNRATHTHVLSDEL